MPRYFFDTSARVKHYHTELGSPKVDLILGESASEYFIARLTLAEVTSAFAKKARTGEIPDADFDRLCLRKAHRASPDCPTRAFADAFARLLLDKSTYPLQPELDNLERVLLPQLAIEQFERERTAVADRTQVGDHPR